MFIAADAALATSGSGSEASAEVRMPFSVAFKNALDNGVPTLAPSPSLCGILKYRCALSFARCSSPLMPVMVTP
jgi:hypothetical protein